MYQVVVAQVWFIIPSALMQKVLALHSVDNAPMAFAVSQDHSVTTRLQCVSGSATVDKKPSDFAGMSGTMSG